MLKNINTKLLLACIILVLFGLLMLFSTSIYYSAELYNNPYHIINKQLLYLFIALIIGALVINTSIDKIEQLAVVLFGITLLLLALVFVPYIGVEVKGSNRWINLGLLHFQPSELLKITMILFMARFLVRQESNIQSNIMVLFAAGLVLFIVAILLLFETDIGAFFIVTTTTLSMLFIAKTKIKAFMVIILTSIVGFISFILFLPERLARISAFVDPWGDPYGKSYQLVQSLIAIGKGQWFGVGLGASVQKMQFLPDAHTDFIFAIIGEEFGVVGMLLVLFLFVYLIYQMFAISYNALYQHKKYSAFVAFGIGVWFSLQVFINIGVNTGLLPTKGLTLPFFSFGGSSLLISVISLAIIFRIDYENRQLHYQKY